MPKQALPSSPPPPTPLTRAEGAWLAPPPAPCSRARAAASRARRSSAPSPRCRLRRPNSSYLRGGGGGEGWTGGARGEGAARDAKVVSSWHVQVLTASQCCNRLRADPLLDSTPQMCPQLLLCSLRTLQKLLLCPLPNPPSPSQTPRLPPPRGPPFQLLTGRRRRRRRSCTAAAAAVPPPVQTHPAL
jgi:hypothetical protein